MELRFNEVPRDWEKFLRYIEGSLDRKPLYNEFVEKQPKCLLYQRIVIIVFSWCYVTLTSISGSEL